MRIESLWQAEAPWGGPTFTEDKEVVLTRVDGNAPWAEIRLVLPAGRAYSDFVDMGENPNSGGAFASNYTAQVGAYVPPPQTCDTHAVSGLVQLANGNLRNALGQVTGFPTGKDAASGVLNIGLAGGELVPLGAVTSVGLRAAGAGLLRAGTYAIEGVTPAGAILVLGTLALEVAGKLVTVPITPIEPGGGLLDPLAPLRLRYDLQPVPSCPVDPGTSPQFPGELTPQGKPSPWPVDAPEIPVPVEPDVAGLDLCCARQVQTLFQVVQQANACAQSLQYIGQILDKRLTEIRSALGEDVGERLLKVLEEIRKGVYHKDSTGAEMPLAKEILGVLNGLNIHI